MFSLIEKASHKTSCYKVSALKQLSGHEALCTGKSHPKRPENPDPQPPDVKKSGSPATREPVPTRGTRSPLQALPPASFMRPTSTEPTVLLPWV